MRVSVFVGVSVYTRICVCFYVLLCVGEYLYICL